MDRKYDQNKSSTQAKTGGDMNTTPGFPSNPSTYPNTGDTNTTPGFPSGLPFNGDTPQAPSFPAPFPQTQNRMVDVFSQQRPANVPTWTPGSGQWSRFQQFYDTQSPIMQEMLRRYFQP